MGSFDWSLELVLVGLLGVVLFHAVRLERALRVWRNDRVALGEAIAGFDNSAKQAEIGLGRLQSVSTETNQALSTHVERGTVLKDDLAYLVERGEALADRLDELVRAGRPLAQQLGAGLPVSTRARPAAEPVAAAQPTLRSKAERDLLLALQAAQ